MGWFLWLVLHFYSLVGLHQGFLILELIHCVSCMRCLARKIKIKVF